jgi:predicted membrane GTPase involved in stress response
MKNLLMAFAAICAALCSHGCTTLRPSVLSTDEIHRQIVSGELLKPGDKVRLTTKDGAVHDFQVTEIKTDEGLVVGHTESVRVADIVGVGKREIAVGKTIGLVIGIVGGLQLGYAIGSIGSLTL